jgi:hypothetical protein
LPARFLIDDVEVERKLPIKDHPYSLALPVWGEAGFFRFASIDAPFPEAYTHHWDYTPPNLRETLGLTPDQKLNIWVSEVLILSAEHGEPGADPLLAYIGMMRALRVGKSTEPEQRRKRANKFRVVQ